MADAKLLEKVYVGEIGGEAVERKSYFAEADALVIRTKGREILRVAQDNLDQLSGSIGAALMFHGTSQKLGDAAVKPSGAEKRDEYEADPSAYIEDRVLSVWENLQGGMWVERAETAGPRVTLLVEALARAGGIDTGQAGEIVATWPDGKKKAAAKVPEIAKALEEIKAERAAARKAALDAAADASDGEGLAELLAG